MISATGYVLECEAVEGCAERRYDDNRFSLWNDAEREGWQLRVKLNGERAIRAGKDYCPRHLRSAGPGTEGGSDA
jgi:hypothetical protein